MGPQFEFRTIQSPQGFALERFAHHDSVLKHGQVEGMQRLAGFKQNIIGHVDHIVDRSQPHGGQTVSQPLRTRSDFDPPDDPRGVKWTAGILQPDKIVRLFLRHRRHGGQRCFDLGQSRHFAGHAAVAEQIRTVGRHFQFKHGVGREEFLHRFAHRQVRGQNKQSLRILGQRQFLRTAEHAIGLFAAQFARFDFEIRTEHRAGQRERNLVADLEIFRTTNNLPRLARAVIDLAYTQAVGIGMRRTGKDLGDDDLVRDIPPLLASDHFGAALGQGLGQCVRRFRQLHVIFEPLEGNLHDANCERNRWSFSTNIRISGTP